MNSQVPFLSSPEEEDSSRGDGIRRLACIGISPLFLAQVLASRLMQELKVFRARSPDPPRGDRKEQMRILYPLPLWLLLFSLEGVVGLFPPKAKAQEPLSFPAILTLPEGERKEALHLYLQIYPEDPRGYNTLGVLFLKEKDYATAEALFARALSLNPRESKYRYNHLLALFYQDRFLEALKGLWELYREDPRYIRERLDLERARGEVISAYQRTHHPLLGMILRRWDEIRRRYERGDLWP